MIISADKFIEFINIRFRSFDIEVLSSKIFGESSLKE